MPSMISTNHKVDIVSGVVRALCGSARDGDKCVDDYEDLTCAKCMELTHADHFGATFPEPVSPMPENSSAYEILVQNLIPRIIRTLGVATAEGAHTMLDLVSVYERILESKEQSRDEKTLEYLKTNCIELYFNCTLCSPLKPNHISLMEWSRMQAGFTKYGLQVWCNRCDKSVLHIDHENKVMV